MRKKKEETEEKALKENVEVEETEDIKKSKKNMISAALLKDNVITECSSEARELYEKSRYGTALEDGRVQLTLIEAYYLLKKGKITLKTGNKKLNAEEFLKRCIRLEKNFWIRFAVYSDFRNRGYIIKTALKFGADFRVYNKGIKPGEDHARWIVYPVKETTVSTWYEFAAKNRVAHSTKKRLLIGIVDEENAVTYYEIKWTRP
jgi:tRNA-intron endonuclease, archaea type